jgi:UDP-glucose 4-epimerase
VLGAPGVNPQDLLDYVDHHNLGAGLTKMWKWARAQPVREQRVWESYELEKGIYEYWR